MNRLSFIFYFEFLFNIHLKCCGEYCYLYVYCFFSLGDQASGCYQVWRGGPECYPGNLFIRKKKEKKDTIHIFNILKFILLFISLYTSIFDTTIKICCNSKSGNGRSYKMVLLRSSFSFYFFINETNDKTYGYDNTMSSYR